ncbi:hypothetical protein HAHE_13990 [Haloferula helveola]|uniref:SGNH hydrolase-type esterase domain-containing protein n=1 Tax=Haloferula helveola TaxID=490095 RepID=A0ABM7R8S3_9BACT|nr:hypothetical protein HAHE_13990 [Haloferula helveola]
MFRLRSALFGIGLLASAAGLLRAEESRVLCLTDNIHARMVAQPLARELGKDVKVEIPRNGPNDSGTAIAELDTLLGETKWDVIYFNYGIGELFYKDPATQEIRAMSKNAGGVRVATPEQYGKNLDELVKRLKATGAKLLWGTTTPLVNVHSFPSYQGNLFDADSEVEYNSIAAAVMKRHGVPVVDVHAHVMAQFGPDEKHPGFASYDKTLNQKDKSPVHEPVVRAIRSSLK